MEELKFDSRGCLLVELHNNNNKLFFYHFFIRKDYILQTPNTKPI